MRDGNNQGPVTGTGFNATLSDEFAALEALPPPLRAALVEAPLKFSAVECLQFYRKVEGRAPIDVIVAHARDAWAKVVRRGVGELYGPDHPQAAA